MRGFTERLSSRSPVVFDRAAHVLDQHIGRLDYADDAAIGMLQIDN